MGICIHEDFCNKYVVYLNFVMYKNIPAERTGPFVGPEYTGFVRSSSEQLFSCMSDVTFVRILVDNLQMRLKWAYLKPATIVMQ
jgi:hypothetical protein